MVADLLNDIDLNANNMAANVATLWGDLQARFIPAADGPVACWAQFRTARQTRQWQSQLRHLFMTAYPNDDIAFTWSAIDQFMCSLHGENVKIYMLENDTDTNATTLTTPPERRWPKTQLQLTEELRTPARERTVLNSSPGQPRDSHGQGVLVLQAARPPGGGLYKVQHVVKEYFSSTFTRAMAGEGTHRPRTLKLNHGHINIYSEHSERKNVREGRSSPEST